MFYNHLIVETTQPRDLVPGLFIWSQATTTYQPQPTAPNQNPKPTGGTGLVRREEPVPPVPTLLGVGTT